MLTTSYPPALSNVCQNKMAMLKRIPEYTIHKFPLTHERSTDRAGSFQQKFALFECHKHVQQYKTFFTSAYCCFITAVNSVIMDITKTSK